MKNIDADTLVLKPTQMRKLRNGRWVVVAEGSEAITIDEEYIQLFNQKNNLDNTFKLEDYTELHNAGFFTTKEKNFPTPPKAPNSPLWKIGRLIMWTIGIISIIISSTIILHYGIPSGKDIIESGNNPFFSFSIAISAAIITAIPHEMAHILFGSTRRRKYKNLKINIPRSYATTDLTHIWSWKLSARMMAISSGIIIDLAILSIILLANTRIEHWILHVITSAIGARIIWQLGFHRNCDGHHIAKMAFDNPTMYISIKSLIHTLKREKEINLPEISFSIIGIIMDLILIKVWILSALIALVTII